MKAPDPEAQRKMESQTLIFSLLFLFISLKFVFRKTKRKLNLPPTPATELPVIGHLHLLKPVLHRTFLSLSETLGGAPIFSLRLGNRLVFVVSSRSIAEECFSKNDVVLANRPVSIFGKHVGYNQTNMIGAPYGEHWRNLRRIGAVEIFSSQRLNSFLSVRKDEIRRLILCLSRNSLHGFKRVEMKSMFVDLTFNSIMRMISGKRYSGNGDGTVDSAEAKRVRELVAEVMVSSGAGNAADYFPVLRWVTDYEKRVKNLAGRVDEFLQRLIDEKRAAKEKGNTLMDRLISLQESQPEYYSDVIIKAIMLSLIVAGTDTTAITLEWALSNLLNHPDTLKKARTEIDNKVGLDRLIDEPDIADLPYLQSIVFETLRLYPAVPMLLPHMSSEGCTVAGYDMPRGTTLLVNAWAIHRDPLAWGDEPARFNPERFENRGEAEKLMPFGLGRRACPGAGLAQRFLGLGLGSLIQCFEWERVSHEKVDMAEDKGATMPKTTPLQAMCKARPIVLEIPGDSA